MPTQIQRYAPTTAQLVKFAPNLADCTTLCLSTAAAFCFLVPAGTQPTTIIWHASHKDEGPFYPVVLSNGNAASTIVTAGQIFIAPPELFACTYVRGAAAAGFEATVMTKT